MEPQDQQASNLEELLDEIEGAARDRDRVSLDHILESVGRRSFGPILVLAGVIIVMPLIGDIPGVPSIMGVLVVLTVGQLLFGRDHFWLPNWLLNRSVEQEKLQKALSWFQKPARWVDRIIRPRMQRLVSGPGTYVIAIASVLVALATPFMEVVPFSANLAGAALIAFGLALIAHDGLLAAIALLITAGTFVVVLNNLL